MIKLFTGLTLLVLLGAMDARPAKPDTDMQVFEFDERYWVVFYDLPSRRFRAIRDAFVRRDFAAAASDLRVSEGFLRIEIQRASPALAAPLTEVADRLAQLARDVEKPDTTTNDIDRTAARAHWLLSQHYLELAEKSRDTSQHWNAAHYLLATAHHLERAILWSNARIDSATLDALDGMREVSNELLSSKFPARAYRTKPIMLAKRTIVRVGEQLDRPVFLEVPGASSSNG